MMCLSIPVILFFNLFCCERLDSEYIGRHSPFLYLLKTCTGRASPALPIRALDWDGPKKYLPGSGRADFSKWKHIQAGLFNNNIKKILELSFSKQ